MSDKNYFIHETAIIDQNVYIGDDTKIWHFSHIQTGAVIGMGCILGQNVFIANNVVLGKNVKVQNNVSLYSGVICEDDVFLGPSMVFTNIRLPRSEFPQKGSIYYEKTLVKKSASIGANATIIYGVTIGEYALIGSGTVVTKDVPDYALVIGNPGKITGWVSKIGERLVFNDRDIAICNKNGEKYQLINNHVKLVR